MAEETNRLTCKTVHLYECNGEEIIADEDVDVRTHAQCIRFDDHETLQEKFNMGAFVSPSLTGMLEGLHTQNNVTLVSAINETVTNTQDNRTSINSINENLTNMENRLTGVLTVSLAADGWTGDSAPFTQTAEVTGAKEGMEPILVSMLQDGAELSVQKAYNKAWGIICGGTAEIGEGTATFKVYKKPAGNIDVGLKGA